jgi:hypothetical protein
MVEEYVEKSLESVDFELMQNPYHREMYYISVLIWDCCCQRGYRDVC